MQVGVNTQAWSSACKVTCTQEKVRSENVVVVMCGKNLFKLVTKG